MLLTSPNTTTAPQFDSARKELAKLMAALEQWRRNCEVAPVNLGFAKVGADFAKAADPMA